MRKIITLLIIVSNIYFYQTIIIFADEQEKGNKDKIELHEDQKAFLNGLEEEGLLNLMPDSNAAYINPNFWAQMNIKKKEYITAIIAIYCGNYKKTYLYWAEIYDLMSGKKLAENGDFGFKVY